jgi:O-antigen ligase
MASTTQSTKIVSTATRGDSATLIWGGGAAAFVIGAAISLATPPEDSAQFLRLPFAGSYLVTYYDLLIGLAFLYCLFIGALKIDRREHRIYVGVGLVILTRVLSLVFADSMEGQQIFSMLRYLSTLATLILLANLLSSRRNRRSFLVGVMTGAVLESVGGLLIFCSSWGEERGIWLGLDNYKLQVFGLLLCSLALWDKAGRTQKLLTGLLLTAGIMVTGTRRALVLFFFSMVFLVYARRRALLKPLLGLLIFGTIAWVALPQVLPEGEQTVVDRMDQSWGGGGTIGFRFVLWEMAAAAYLNHPITGLGSGGFARQQDSLYFAVNDAFPEAYADKYTSLSTHNTVLGVAAETGTLGLAAYLFWVAAVTSFVLKTWKLGQFGNDSYIIAVCVFLLALLLEDWWGQASFMPPSTCLLGLILGWRRSETRISPPTLSATAP